MDKIPMKYIIWRYSMPHQTRAVQHEGSKYSSKITSRAKRVTTKKGNKIVSWRAGHSWQRPYHSKVPALLPVLLQGNNAIESPLIETDVKKGMAEGITEGRFDGVEDGIRDGAAEGGGTAT